MYVFSLYIGTYVGNEVNERLQSIKPPQNVSRYLSTWNKDLAGKVHVLAFDYTIFYVVLFSFPHATIASEYKVFLLYYCQTNSFLMPLFSAWQSECWLEILCLIQTLRSQNLYVFFGD